MALSEGTPQSFSDNSGQIATVKLADNKAIVAYDDVIAATGQARILDISSGSLVVGAANEINDDRIEPHIDVLSSIAAILLYEDSGTSSLTLRKLNVSGTTITEAAKEVVEAASTGAEATRVAAVSSTLGLVAYSTGPGNHKLCRFTISGDTVTAGTPQSHGTDVSAQPLGLIALSSTKVFYTYHDGSNRKFQVIDIDSGITEGTPQTDAGEIPIGAYPGVGAKAVAALSSTKVVVIYGKDATPDQLRVVCVTTSGNSIDTIGTPQTIISNDNDYEATIFPNGTDGAIIIYSDGTNTFIETLSVSGTTITLNNDDLTLTQGATSGGIYLSVPIVIDTKAIAIMQDINDDDGYASLISGVPSGNGGGTPGIFYFGQGALIEKFTAPFSGVAPKAMTLDQALGTVVLGSRVASVDPIIYSNYPYPTGTATHSGFPTGTSITVVRWI